MAGSSTLQLERPHPSDVRPKAAGSRNAIIGTLLLMAGVLILAGGIGVPGRPALGRIRQHHEKTGKESGGLLRIASDVLSGFPSIVLRLRRLRGPRCWDCTGASRCWQPGSSLFDHGHPPIFAKFRPRQRYGRPTAYAEGAEALGMPSGYAGSAK